MPRKRIETHDFGSFVVTQIKGKKGIKARIKRKKKRYEKQVNGSNQQRKSGQE